MKKIRLFSLISFLFCIVTVLASCSASDNKNFLDNNVYVLEEANIEKYDYYEYVVNEKNILLDVIEKCDDSNLKNLGYNLEVEVSIAYSLNYDIDAEAIFVTMTTSSQDEVLSIEQLTAYPFIYEDGSVDAFVYFDDGSTIYLSEIYDGDIKNCFAFALSFSIAALISAMVTAAKVAVVITAVVVVAGATIEVAQMTKAKLEERTRAAEIEKTKKNPQYYYPATRKNGKLLISSVPQGLIAASKAILTGIDYWSPYPYTAKNLAVRASGGSLGPEVDSNSKGKYYHYHLLGRVGGHSFFGSPVGGAY